jgi:hypothetical protein
MVVKKFMRLSNVYAYVHAYVCVFVGMSMSMCVDLYPVFFTLFLSFSIQRQIMIDNIHAYKVEGGYHDRSR